MEVNVLDATGRHAGKTRCVRSSMSLAIKEVEHVGRQADLLVLSVADPHVGPRGRARSLIRFVSTP
ncbi:hypothetical protein [Piscinibacter koreensis]|uniref:Uncharacterized protein n=1 Tax=Piscinibacter koreensis TaxID=2742824 RepID=A0A7Y6NS97_9BURK|nr:hypothetical protein [Schlegelella koreensis]NUZ08412.1 hypothetical protein [Schlegelella koreensis]